MLFDHWSVMFYIICSLCPSLAQSRHCKTAGIQFLRSDGHGAQNGWQRGECDGVSRDVSLHQSYLSLQITQTQKTVCPRGRLRSAFQPEAQEELSSLHDYASSNGFSEKMQMWDVDYWSRKQRDDLYGSG